MYSLLEKVNFQCYVSLPEGNGYFVVWVGGLNFWAFSMEGIVTLGVPRFESQTTGPQTTK